MELTKLNELRKSKGIKISEISRATGLGRVTINSILEGNDHAKLNCVEAIADYLGVKLELILK